jgi:5-methylcytosine-specific restriction endonuclease McrA
MARPKMDPFIYVPMKRNLSRAKNKGENELKKYLRNCGSNYIKREAVRNFVLLRDDYLCVRCRSKYDLQIDHILSVYQGWKNNIPLEEINSLSNLQTLCKSCNAGKEVYNGET